jgi:hypothetical protein
MKIKHYLIASESNDYRPWITTTSALVFFCVIVWGLRVLVPANLTLASGSIDPYDLMNRINQQRDSRNLTTLKTNDKLVAAAQIKSDDMLHRGYFAHINPDGNYVWPTIEAQGYKPYVTLGENLAMDFTSASDVVAAWLNSPTHRANILNPTFQDQGLAVSSGLYEPGHNSILVASLFGTLTKPVPNLASSQTSSNSTPASNTLAIGDDAKISITQVSGHTLVDVNVAVSGNPTLITAKLNQQSITLLKSDDRFAGTFTFNLSENLNGQSITVEARNSANTKVTSQIPLENIQTLPAGNDSSVAGTKIPASSDAELLFILRIVFGVLSVVYLGFLITDWIIIHRAKIVRPGMHLQTQVVIFALVAIINIFAKF